MALIIDLWASSTSVWSVEKKHILTIIVEHSLGSCLYLLAKKIAYIWLVEEDCLIHVTSQVS